MSLTDRDRIDAERDAADDPQASPVTDPPDPGHTSPVPTVARRAGSETTSRPRAADDRKPVRFVKVGRAGDRIFRTSAGGSSVFIVALVAFVGIFLLALALPSLVKNQGSFLTSRTWQVTGDQLDFGIAGLLWTTVLTAVIAMVIAVPISIGVALCLTHYVPKRLSGPLAFVVDLLAAVPSIIYGLWGIIVLAPRLDPIVTGVTSGLGFIPLFGAGLSSASGTAFLAGVVLAIMVLPIVTAISRDVFAQTPTEHVEGALALGATRWEMIRVAVLPYGRSGVISASMLGLGRALGETIAVMILLSAPSAGSPFSPSIFAGGETFASKIANSASEFDTPSKTGAYIAAGLVLFVVTFAVNAIARVIAGRGSART